MISNFRQPTGCRIGGTVLQCQLGEVAIELFHQYVTMALRVAGASVN